MSNLTEPVEELEREAIAALEGEGFAYNPLTTDFARYLAVCLGSPNAYKTKSVTRMLAELNSDLGGSTVSYLTRSYADLLDTLETTIGSGGGGGGLPTPPSGFAYLVNKDTEYLVNADGAYILAKV